ncbi:hypothetical protein CSC82_33330, partial [Rhodobacteraceae bacterium 4F10]
MIQRIQSIYLLVAGIISGGLTFLFSLWSNSQTNYIYILDLFSGNSILEKSIPVLFFITALVSIVTIFLFKNRQLQFVLNRL